MEKAMESSVLTLRINNDTKDKLDKLASATHRSKSFLAAEAINRYLEIGLNFSFVSIVFLGAIFFFDLEPEINSYLKKGKIYLQSKFKK